MADQPHRRSWEERRPLEYAKTPMMDELAKVSEIRHGAHGFPTSMSPGSDTSKSVGAGAMIRRSIYFGKVASGGA